MWQNPNQTLWLSNSRRRANKGGVDDRKHRGARTNSETETKNSSKGKCPVSD